MPDYCQALYSAILHPHAVENRINTNINRTDDSCNNEKNLYGFHSYSPGAGVIKIATVTSTAIHSRTNIFCSKSIIQTTVYRKGAMMSSDSAEIGAVLGSGNGMGEHSDPHFTPLFHTPRSSAIPMQMRIILNGLVFMLCFCSYGNSVNFEYTTLDSGIMIHWYSLLCAFKASFILMDISL